MSKIAILTDSSCDIPQEMAEKYGIDIRSFHILLDDVDYGERVDLSLIHISGVPRPPVWVESTTVGSATGWKPMTDSTGRITARLHRPTPDRSWMQMCIRDRNRARYRKFLQTPKRRLPSVW